MFQIRISDLQITCKPGSNILPNKLHKKWGLIQKSIVIYLLWVFLFHLPSWAYKIESSSFPYTLYRLGLWKHTTKSLDFYQINLQVLIFTICFYFSTACYSLFWMLNSLYLVTFKIALSFIFWKIHYILSPASKCWWTVISSSDSRSFNPDGSASLPGCDVIGIFSIGIYSHEYSIKLSLEKS